MGFAACRTWKVESIGRVLPKRNWLLLLKMKLVCDLVWG